MIRKRTADQLVISSLTTGTIAASGTITSSVASGSNAISLATEGSRIKFGPGSTQYLSGSNGSQVYSPGAMRVDGTFTINGAISSIASSWGIYTTDGIRATVGASAITLATGIKFAHAAPGDSSASPGAATINQPSGKAAVAAGASSVVITNSTVTTSSHIFITPLDIDTTLKEWKVAAANGSFTFTGNANATAAFKFQFLVVN